MHDNDVCQMMRLMELLSEDIPGSSANLSFSQLFVILSNCLEMVSDSQAASSTLCNCKVKSNNPTRHRLALQVENSEVCVLSNAIFKPPLTQFSTVVMTKGSPGIKLE